MMASPQFDGALAHLLSSSASEILAALADGVVISDLEGNVLSMNPAALRMHGFADVAEARQPLHLFPAQFAVFLEDGTPVPLDQWPLSRVLRGETLASFEAEVRRPDPACSFFASYSGHLVLSAEGVPEAAVLTIRDITESKRIQRELRRSEEERLLALEAAAMGAWRRHLQTGEVYFSPRCRQQFGFTANLVITRTQIYAAIHPADRVATEAAVEAAIHNHTDYETEYRVCLPDGTVRWLAVKGRASYDAQGEPSLLQGVSMDITERHRISEELQAAQRQFHHSQKLDSLGVLAGGVAHDFNNLLTGILGNASLVMDNLAPDDENRTMLDEVLRASERAADLTRQLLAYAGKGKFVTQQIDLSALVREMNRLIRTSIPKKVHIVLHLPAVLPAIAGDPTQIQQIAMNLILNAAEAIGPNDPGTVLVETCLVDVDPLAGCSDFNAEALAAGPYVSLMVHDSGAGMDEVTRTRIFDPFFTTKFTGRGLGLSAVLGIVRAHRGALRVESKPGHGTSFTVLFPLAPNQALPGAEEAHGSQMVLAIGKCHAELRGLQGLGYPVLFCDTLSRADALLREGCHPVAVVICSDTEEDQPAVVHRYRPGVQVILTSDLPPAEQIRRYPGHCYSAFIRNGSSAEELGRAIQRVLSVH